MLPRVTPVTPWRRLDPAADRPDCAGAPPRRTSRMRRRWVCARSACHRAAASTACCWCWCWRMAHGETACTPGQTCTLNQGGIACPGVRAAGLPAGTSGTL